MKSGDYVTEMRELRALARQVGSELAKHYGVVEGVEQKTDGSTVSDMDRWASEVILNGLDTHFPDFGVLEEESGRDDRFTRERVIGVDPLDSSYGYAHRTNQHYSILMYIMEELRPVAGLVYKPHFHEMAWAIRGQGAFIRSSALPMRKLRVPERLPRSITVTRRRGWEALAQFLDEFEADDVATMSGSAKFLEVAKGTMAVSYQPPQNTLSLWDVGSIQVIVEEAGGVVRDAYGNEISHAQPNVELHKGVIAAYNERMMWDTVLAQGRLED